MSEKYKVLYKNRTDESFLVEVQWKAYRGVMLLPVEESRNPFFCDHKTFKKEWVKC